MFILWIGLSFYVNAQNGVAPPKKPSLAEPPSAYNIHNCAASLDSPQDSILAIRARPKINATLIPYFLMRDGVKHIGFLAFEVNSEPRSIELGKLRPSEAFADILEASFRFKGVNGVESIVRYEVKNGVAVPLSTRFFGSRKNDHSIPSITPVLLSKSEELSARESVSETLFEKAKGISEQLTNQEAPKPHAADAENQEAGGFRKYLSSLYSVQSAGDQGCNLFLSNYLRHKYSLSVDQAKSKVADMHQKVMAAIPVGPREDRDPGRTPAFTPIDTETATAELAE